MTPPPVALDINWGGKSSISATQSSTWVSNSVHAGLVIHSMPCTPSPADSSSPRMLGPLLLDGKYAWKPGDCQWVTPGMMISFTSRSIASNDSPCCGGWGGNLARTSPGCTCASTG